MKTVCADEHAEQVALCRWWAMYARRIGVAESLLFAIPNGGRRDKTTGARLKAEGVRAGVGVKRNGRLKTTSGGTHD